jgi:hypothetical protein
MAFLACSIDGCTGAARARGWCRRHYLRWYKTGDPLTVRNLPERPEDRFWSKVERSQGCWLWTGGANEHGYGRFQIGRSRDEASVELAHRYSWRLATALDIPPGLCVLHLCDNPPCVNPDHLVLGTQAANVFDMVQKNRQRTRKVTA